MLDSLAPLQRNPADVRPVASVRGQVDTAATVSTRRSVDPASSARMSQDGLVAESSIVPDALLTPRVLKPFGIVMWTATSPNPPQASASAPENRLS